jgi:MFS family permease
MVYEERNVWAGLIVSVLVVGIYIIVVLQQAGAGPLHEVDWVPIMLWAIGAGIAATILISIVWGVVAGRKDPDGAGKSDQRDRDIAHLGGRVEQAFLVIAGLGVLVLCAVEADWFWIANVMFFGFVIAAIVGGVARVIAYRRGLV